jgi:hypothetical protein
MERLAKDGVCEIPSQPVPPEPAGQLVASRQ